MHVPRLLCLVAVARGEFDTPMLGFNTCNVGCRNATFPNAAWLLRAADVLVARGFAARATTPSATSASGRAATRATSM